MLHLDPERLAELADDEPTVAEAEHLAACAQCQAELTACQTLVGLARRNREPLSTPLSDWGALAAELRAEGLLVPAGERGVGGRPQRSRRLASWLRIAAGFVLLAGGVLAGRWSAGGALMPLAAGPSAEQSSAGNATLAAMTTDTLAFSSPSDAFAALDSAQRLYRRAAAYIARTDSSAASEQSPEVIRTRLAALDQISRATLAASREAPQDPLISQYLQAARTARVVTLQQLNQSLPGNARLAAY